jgi:dihydroxyacetone kinase-like protein
LVGPYLGEAPHGWVSDGRLSLAYRSPSVVSSRDLVEGFRELLRVVESQQARLDQLDAIAGDGDHGATVVMGLRAVVTSLPPASDLPAAELLRLAAERFASVGGSTGPLWGTALLRAAQSLQGNVGADLAAMAGAAEAAAAGIAMRGRCAEGDKTLLDVMAPAARALRAAADAGLAGSEAAVRARAAGAAGLEATRELTPRRGRARRFGDRSLGHDDPGAASALLAWEVAARLSGASASATSR